MLPLLVVSVMSPPLPEVDVAAAPAADDKEKELRLPVVMLPLLAVSAIAPPRPDVDITLPTAAELEEKELRMPVLMLPLVAVRVIAPPLAALAVLILPTVTFAPEMLMALPGAVMD